LGTPDQKIQDGIPVFDIVQRPRFKVCVQHDEVSTGLAHKALAKYVGLFFESAFYTCSRPEIHFSGSKVLVEQVHIYYPELNVVTSLRKTRRSQQAQNEERNNRIFI
jgi:hypothetical protein